MRGTGIGNKNLPTKPSADGWFGHEEPCKHAHGVAQLAVGSGCKSSSCSEVSPSTSMSPW
ncbi:Uncharacterised protein [Mycobacterium tuberculosis]|nr:Uncharacterised protein [Mycobacterium tuberculosis]